MYTKDDLIAELEYIRRRDKEGISRLDAIDLLYQTVFVILNYLIQKEK